MNVLLSIGNILGIISSIKGWFENLFDYLRAAIYKMLYSAFASVAEILDAIQSLFQMFAGTAPVVYKSNSMMGNSGNLVMDIITHPFIYGAFIRILVISAILLIIFTAIAIVKSEWSSESTKGSGNAKGPIIGKSLKALFGFILVPMICIVGIMASSYLMQALDKATATSGNTKISNQLFYACSINCNRARNDEDFYLAMSGTNVSGYNISVNNQLFSNYDSKEKMATAIDNAFLTEMSISKLSGVEGARMSVGDRFDNYISKWGSLQDKHIRDDTYFNTKNSSMVFYFYDLSKFNWIMALFSIFFLAGILVKLTLGAAIRVYELAILFVISPAVLSMMPMDGGKAFQTWSKKFIGKVTMIFAPVIALNLYFILIATLNQIDIAATLSNAVNSNMGMVTFGQLNGVYSYIVEQIFSLFIVIAGAKVCEESIKWLGDLIGAEDALGAGNKLKGDISNFVKTNAAITTGAAAAKYLSGKGSAYAKGKMGDAWAGKMNKRGVDSQMAAAKRLRDRDSNINRVSNLNAADALIDSGEVDVSEDISSAMGYYDSSLARMNGVDLDNISDNLTNTYQDAYKAEIAKGSSAHDAKMAAESAASASMKELGITDETSINNINKSLKQNNYHRIATMDKKDRNKTIVAGSNNARQEAHAKYEARMKLAAEGNYDELAKDEELNEELNKVMQNVQSAQKDFEEIKHENGRMHVLRNHAAKKEAFEGISDSERKIAKKNANQSRKDRGTRVLKSLTEVSKGMAREASAARKDSRERRRADEDYARRHR